MDIATIIGLALGLGAALLGNQLEGGSIAGLLQPSAAVIVFGCTFGAAFLAFPMQTITSGFGAMGKLFKDDVPHPQHLIEQVSKIAERARREGLLSLESEAQNIKDPFLKKGIELVVDGIDPEVVGDTLNNEIYALEQRHHHVVAFYEGLGGFAPTMGVLGTVMGLISVLGHLDDPSNLGHAIAVAFVATLYGVASANLWFLPMGTKLKGRSHHEKMVREMMIEAVLSIQAGENPRVIQSKLAGYLSPKERKKLHAEEAKVAVG
jgi:chemotaxis protein MotA